MKKIDSSMLVCTANQAQQLLKLGIEPIACNCYENIAGVWDYSGEYVGQDPVIPAWTMEELNIIIGSAFPKVIWLHGSPMVTFAKPDLYRETDWSYAANMMKYALHLPEKRIDTLNGAEAYAEMAIYLIIQKKLLAEESNLRLKAFADKTFYNPKSETMDLEIKAKQQ